MSQNDEIPRKLAPRKRELENPLTKSLRIKNDTVKRTLKDLQYAKKEVLNEQERLDKFIGSFPDKVPQQENVLIETKAMVPDAENRLRIAMMDLSDFIDREEKNLDCEKILADAHSNLVDVRNYLGLSE